MANKVEMNEKMMEQVNGGDMVIRSQWEDYENGIHPGCGGHILHRGEILSSCVCDKCGKSYYFYRSFFKTVDNAFSTK